MYRQNARRVAALLSLASLTAALSAQGTPIGFEEEYALAPDRAKVVAQLIPGTEDYYYYFCRERLDARDFAAVRAALPTWIKRHGRTDRVLEIENREALLSFDADPERTYDLLRRRLNLTFDHQRVLPGARSDLATRLDPTLVSPATLTQRAFASYPETVDGFTDRALAALSTVDLDAKRLRSLLRRLPRPDVDNLPALIVRDLTERDSGGFGSLPIHAMLRLPQLEECLRLRPGLLQEPRFVQVFLERQQPDADVAWHADPEARAAYLARLWQFAQRLSPGFNSLKAHVLYHWLRHDLTQGAPDKQRFLAYIQLPRRQGHPSRAHLERFQKSGEFVDLGSQYPTLMRPIGDDEDLVRTCLEHFFATEDNYEAYADYLDAAWLKGVLAETKLLLGQGDMERWYSLLNDPVRLEQIEKRVELRFPSTLPEYFGADDAVRIEVETKNVPTLLVKVFAIDSYRYHIEKQREVDATIELDGVVANFEQTWNYEEPPVRRVRRTFDLPMLREPGTYVVEFVGNGISSRAVVHKGGLRMVARTIAAGQIVRIYDERGVHLPQATAWFGGREYQPDDKGEVLLPFSTDPGSKLMVLRHGNRSSLASFTHRAEAYTLAAPVEIDREALVAGMKARVLVRPQLELAGHGVSLQLLHKPVLVVVATDRDGLSTTQEVRDLELADGKELVHEISVPERLAALQVWLRGEVEDLAGKPVALAAPAAAFAVNGIDATAETGTALLARTTGGYVVEVRGKNGEPQTGRVCTLRLVHRDYRDPIVVPLQTDDAGRIQLGPLAGIEQVFVQKGDGTGGAFDLRDAQCRLPAALHGAVGETLRVPYDGDAATPTRAEFSLLGHDRDAFEHLAIADGFLELRKLPPGDYELQLHRTGNGIPVRITRGARDGGWLIGRDRVLSASDPSPLQVQGIAVEGDELRIRLANAGAGARVHVFATRYLPAFDPFTQLEGLAEESMVAIEQDRPQSSYHAGRKLGDEYRYVLERRFATKFPGNMLARPSLLLNPWALADESWNAAVGLGGGAGGKFGGRGGGRARQQQADGASGRPGGGTNPGTFANLDFLPVSAPVLANLPPDKDGVVRVQLARLGDGQQIHVVALDGRQTVYRTHVRAERRLEPRGRTLPKALDAQKHFIEHKGIEFVAGGGSATLDDARSAQVEIHDSLASVYRLFATIHGDAALAEFAFVLQWPKLPREQRLEHYSKHACHELHFFLWHKDPEFFRTVVRPFLANKQDKTFLDEWLLERDLRGWLEPWRFARLNVIEKILLAKRLGGDERAAVARVLRETLELHPIEPAQLERLIDLALKSEELADKTATAGLLQLGAVLKPGNEPEPSAAAPAAPVPQPDAGRAVLRRGAAREEQAKNAEKDDAPAEAAEELVESERGADRKLMDEVEKRKSVARLYRAVEPTRLLVESNYWHRRMADTSPDVVTANHFWIDYATAPDGKPFGSSAIVEATGSFLEMMMALSVLDLPFEAGQHEVVADGDRRTLRAATPLLLVRKQVQEAATAADMPPLLLGENFYRLDDRYRYVDGQRRDAFVTDEFLVDVGYGCQVVVTNPTSSQRTTEVLLQIPAGAIPLQNGFWTRGVDVQLQPYATATVEYAFYFPGAGSFPHYPAHAAEDGKLAASAAARVLKVLTAPSKVDTSSWEHVSQQGSPADVLRFIDDHNVQRLDLGKVAWRMRDREFFTSLLAKLRQRHVYDDTLWSYAILHRDAAGSREYLRHADALLAQCGTWLDSPLVSIDPKERHTFQHLELDPLVHARAHRLGDRRVLGNKDLAAQYRALMDLLGYHVRLDSEDWLAVTYYLLLQDRVEEALASYAKIDPQRIATQVQYDYLSSYLCFFTGDTQKARRIASAHRDDPVLHWQRRFRDVLGQLDEAEGKAPQATDVETPDQLAANAPALELAVEGHNVAIAYRNLTQCEVRYYELDVEFAFSAQPFAGPDGASAAFVQPNLRETKDLPKGQAQVAFDLPQQFWQKNVLVELRAAGLVRARQYFANALDVRFLESYGQVAVTEPNTNKPLAKTYVKVFARLANGQVRFHKDGYTDLRGRFDYASVSDDPNAGAQRYAVLVLDERRGAVIREVAPPAR